MELRWITKTKVENRGIEKSILCNVFELHRVTIGNCFPGKMLIWCYLKQKCIAIPSCSGSPYLSKPHSQSVTLNKALCCTYTYGVCRLSII